MDALTLKINLDCLRKDSQAIINAKVGEANGRKVVFTLYEGRTAFFVPAEATVVFRAQKPDGTILYNHCVIDDGKVEYTITSQTVAVTGVYACELQIVSGGRIIYSPYVTLNVMDNLYADTEVESSNEFTELENALNRIPSLEVINSKYTKPDGGIPKADLSEEVRTSLGKADTALQEHQSLAAYRKAAEQDAIDATKQDKLIAGDNITIAEDGTISATGGTDGVGVLEVTLTTQNGVLTADKTFAQVKAAVEGGDPVLKVHSDGALLWFFLLDKSPTEIDFIGFADEQILAYLTAKQDGSWETTVTARVTVEMLSELSDKLGNLGNLTTTAKNNLVAAINELKSGTAVTEATVSGWGFTKNTGTYSKPTDGIPKADLESDVQTSLGKADTALQSVPSTYRTASAQDTIDSGKVDKVTGKGLSTNDYTDADKTKVDTLAPVAESGSYNDLTDKPTIPSVPTATIQANTAARHEHSNKTVLDLISETVKAAWDAASTWVTTNGANVLSHLSNNVKHITADERTKWNGKQDKLIAGNNITIAADGKTISATGGGGGASGDIETVEAQQIDIPSKLSDFENDSGFVTNSAVETALADKQDTISDLENIRSGAGKGATALQAVPSTYRTASAQDAIDNGLSDRVSAIEGKEAGWNGKYAKPTDGIPKADLESDVQTSLGKADTALQSVPSTYRTASAQDTIDSGKVDKVTGKGLSSNDYTDTDKTKVDTLAPVAESGSYNDLTDKPTIPAAVTEGTVSGWGFTKNTGTYSKPTGGIPKTDLASTVQTSLNKADSALQSHQSLAAYRTASAQDSIDSGKVDKVAGKHLSTNDYTNTAKAKVDAIPANPKYTDTVYDDTAVRNRLTAIENHENVTMTPNTSRITNVSYTAKYFPLLGIVFVRIYGKINMALNAGYDYDLFSIDGRVPDSNTALSVKCGKNAMGMAKTSSVGSAIQIRPLESGINGYDVYITGFWFT